MKVVPQVSLEDVKKDNFLLNGKNKQRYLEHLCDEFNRNGIVATRVI